MTNPALRDLAPPLGPWQMERYGAAFLTPELSQRFEAVISSDGRTITGAWTKSFDGGTTWEHDFNLDYIRTSPFDSEQQ